MRQIELCFSKALVSLKLGQRVRRAGWNGKGMWLAVLDGYGSSYGMVLRGEKLADVPFGKQTAIRYPAHIVMKTAQGDFVPWLASVTDLMAEDWEIVDGD